MNTAASSLPYVFTKYKNDFFAMKNNHFSMKNYHFYLGLFQYKITKSKFFQILLKWLFPNQKIPNIFEMTICKSKYHQIPPRPPKYWNFQVFYSIWHIKFRDLALDDIIKSCFLHSIIYSKMALVLFVWSIMCYVLL